MIPVVRIPRLEILIPLAIIDIWYNKWAGGDMEDNYSKCVALLSGDIATLADHVPYL